MSCNPPEGLFVPPLDCMADLLSKTAFWPERQSQRFFSGAEFSLLLSYVMAYEDAPLQAQMDALLALFPTMHPEASETSIQEIQRVYGIVSIAFDRVFQTGTRWPMDEKYSFLLHCLQSPAEDIKQEFMDRFNSLLERKDVWTSQLTA